MSVTVATLSRAAVLPEHATRALVLRQELKEWEAIFALENGGRKATREEIKGNAGVGECSDLLFRTPILPSIMVDRKIVEQIVGDR